MAAFGEAAGAACCLAGADVGGGAVCWAGGSCVMMLTGGIAAEFAKSTVFGLPDGTPGSMLAAGEAGGAAAALFHDDE